MSISNKLDIIAEKTQTVYDTAYSAGYEEGSVSGGVQLPELTNEGTSADLRKDKELINDEGDVVVGTIETFDGSYECSGESTGGGSIEAWTGTVYVWTGLGGVAPTLYYTDETLTTRMVGNGSSIDAEITIAAGTSLFFSMSRDFTILNNAEDITGSNDADNYSCIVIHPTANGFEIST